MEKDDFRYALAFGPHQFGGPSWNSLIDPQVNAAFAAEGRVPLLFDVEGRSLVRNFVHVHDLVSALLVTISNPRAIGELFHIAMTRPVDYAELCELLRHRGMQAAIIKTPFHSNHFCNAKARFTLRWEPSYDLEKLIADAFSYQRSPDDPRTLAYPG
jgi:nucleoside-diphosphate-sugar epimerase